MTGCAASHFFSSCVRSTGAGVLVGSAPAVVHTAIAPAARHAAATEAINQRLRAPNALTRTSYQKPPKPPNLRGHRWRATGNDGIALPAINRTGQTNWWSTVAVPTRILCHLHRHGNTKLSATFFLSGRPAFQSGASGSLRMHALLARDSNLTK
jgi:hypothetical protein